MGDDIGWFNIGAYHQGIMAGRTPNLDKLAAQGMRFTDYYAEASCTAGRANFITGQLPIRTGLDDRRPGRLADRNAEPGPDDRHGAQVDGLRHRPVRQEPPGRSEPVPAHGPRLRRILRLPLSPGRDGRPGASQLSAGAEGHGRAAEHGPLLGHRQGRPTVQPRWGKIGKQKIEDAGTLYPKRMETVDDEILDLSLKFVDKARKDNKPFFLWLNPTRMHVVTHLSEKYEATAQRRKTAGAFRKPAWRNWTTSSARS